MKSGLIGLLSLVLVVAFSGCGGSETAPAGDDGAASPAGQETRMERRDREEAAEGSATVETAVEEAPAAVEEAAPAPEAAPMPEVAEAPVEEAAPAADGLVGTKWTHNGISMEFKEGNKVQLSGGQLPGAQEFDYTLTDGEISVDVLGQVYTGTWDGTTLIVGGTEAVAAE